MVACTVEIVLDSLRWGWTAEQKRSMGHTLRKKKSREPYMLRRLRDSLLSSSIRHSRSGHVAATLDTGRANRVAEEAFRGDQANSQSCILAHRR